MKTLAIVDRFSRKRIRRATDEYLDRLRRGPVLVSQGRARELLRELRAEPGPKVHLGDTAWGEPVIVPLEELVRGAGITTGGTGAGKSMAACILIEALVRLLPRLRSMAFGVLDAKGELFERALYLLARRLEELEEPEREALQKRIVVIDFSSREAVSPYNILARWPYTETDFFVTSRLETLRELLPAGEKLSLRGATVLKHALLLLSEFGLPLTYLDRVLSSETLRKKLVSRSENPEVRFYFERHFREEGKQTIAALRARMDSLFASEGVKLALAGASAPDFRRFQNEGKIVLINCAGPTITRGVRLLLQGLVLSDIRQAIFARPNQPPVTYLWLADEAQNFFLTRTQQEDIHDICTMARSFGTFFHFLCQNISTAVPDSRVLETLHTNIRWSLTLRSTPRDAQFLRSALPVTGRRRRPTLNPFEETRAYSPEEERALALEGIAHLPDREGYLLLKTRSPEAIRLRTRSVRLPDNGTFREAIEALRQDSQFGGRLSRASYERMTEERDRTWLGEDRAPGNLQDEMEARYEREARV
jgi:hypothetical protein